MEAQIRNHAIRDAHPSLSTPLVCMVLVLLFCMHRLLLVRPVRTAAAADTAKVSSVAAAAVRHCAVTIVSAVIVSAP